MKETPKRNHLDVVEEEKELHRAKEDEQHQEEE